MVKKFLDMLNKYIYIMYEEHRLLNRCQDSSHQGWAFLPGTRTRKCPTRPEKFQVAIITIRKTRKPETRKKPESLKCPKPEKTRIHSTHICQKNNTFKLLNVECCPYQAWKPLAKDFLTHLCLQVIIESAKSLSHSYNSMLVESFLDTSFLFIKKQSILIHCFADIILYIPRVWVEHLIFIIFTHLFFSSLQACWDQCQESTTKLGHISRSYPAKLQTAISPILAHGLRRSGQHYKALNERFLLLCQTLKSVGQKARYRCLNFGDFSERGVFGFFRVSGGFSGSGIFRISNQKCSSGSGQLFEKVPSPVLYAYILIQICVDKMPFQKIYDIFLKSSVCNYQLSKNNQIQ
eukprot:TRINITY_DN1555_c0_g1_i4.p1 TRINITY_DN1555_c0_g1~~TRINITY_DN1555_c0_g1_i4.p1  ORF type:complete len:349 (-),score=-6.91 TRINITY_DN1555_c0_g1_i4:1350-2396(-)